MFLQHNINGVMYRKEEAGDSLNNKLERKSRTEFVSNCESLSVLNNFELCYRGTGTSWSRGGGFRNCGVFLAHNYVSEQFGNYVQYGIYNIYIYIYLPPLLHQQKWSLNTGAGRKIHAGTWHYAVLP